MTKPLAPGLYRHFKGPSYYVRGEAINTTNGAGDEVMVVYVKAEDEKKADAVPFVRRKAEFCEVVAWPDGFPRPRWAPEEMFKPKAKRAHQWIGHILVTLLYLLDDIAAYPQKGQIRYFLWGQLRAYLNDVLDPVTYDPSSPHDMFWPSNSDETLAPLFDGDREAMLAEVRARYADVSYMMDGNPEMADLTRLAAFVNNKLVPLAREEVDRASNTRRRRRGCFG